MKRKFIFLLLGIEILLLILFSFDLSIPCIFKSILKIPCPGCGLTRAYHLFLQGHFIEAFFQNILFYPILLFMIIFHIIIIKDFISKKERIGQKIISNKILWFFVGIFLIISEIYNVIIGV